jgi:hypothetical protein
MHEIAAPASTAMKPDGSKGSNGTWSGLIEVRSYQAALLPKTSLDIAWAKKAGPPHLIQDTVPNPGELLTGKQLEPRIRSALATCSWRPGQRQHGPFEKLEMEAQTKRIHAFMQGQVIRALFRSAHPVWWDGRQRLSRNRRFVERYWKPEPRCESHARDTSTVPST